MRPARIPVTPPPVPEAAPPSQAFPAIETKGHRPPRFQVGERVAGQFEIRSLLGEGGMAQVFEAKDLRLDRTIALKVGVDPDGPSLDHEARALAAFSHPSLVTVHAIGSHEGEDFIVLERIYGVTLGKHIKTRRMSAEVFEVAEVLDLVSAIAEGLVVVHRAGLAHRDVKPANVMLTPDQRVVLMDFGLVLADDKTGGVPVVAGSAPYMAPEVLLHRVQPGSAYLSDVFALGVILYEMLVGERPFSGTKMNDVIASHAAMLTPKLREKRRDVPRALDALVRDMLAFDARDRPQNSEALAWQLRNLAKGIRRKAFDTAIGNPSIPPPAPLDADALGLDVTSFQALDVLIVEDDDAIAKLLDFYVKAATGKDCTIRRAADGVEAIAALRERAPDVMLLDLHMPRMTGIEVCMRMRSERIGDETKIVSVSAGAQEEDLQLLHKLGMHHFIQKGGDLRQRVTDVLKGLFPQHCQ